MKIHKCKLEGIILIEPKLYRDERGFFLESFEANRYQALGIDQVFVQDNHSRSRQNVLRGLHYNKSKPQAQLVTVMRGRIFDVVVDIRKNSPTFGEWFGTELGDQGIRQIYMAPGFAHGFCVLSEVVDLHYKVSQVYDPVDDGGLIWNDSEIQIQWPLKNLIISIKDQHNISLEKLIAKR